MGFGVLPGTFSSLHAMEWPWRQGGKKNSNCKLSWSDTDGLHIVWMSSLPSNYQHLPWGMQPTEPQSRQENRFTRQRKAPLTALNERFKPKKFFFYPEQFEWISVQSDVKAIHVWLMSGLKNTSLLCPQSSRGTKGRSSKLAPLTRPDLKHFHSWVSRQNEATLAVHVPWRGGHSSPHIYTLVPQNGD